MSHWLLHWLGMDNASGPVYLAWSGWGGDLSTIGIVGALAGLLRKHNCHVHRCWRLGRHPVEGTPYIVCRRHHPDGAPTHEHILAAHRAHVARTAPPAEPASRKLRRPSGQVAVSQEAADAVRDTLLRKGGDRA